MKSKGFKLFSKNKELLKLFSSRKFSNAPSSIKLKYELNSGNLGCKISDGSGSNDSIPAKTTLKLVNDMYADRELQMSGNLTYSGKSSYSGNKVTLLISEDKIEELIKEYA
jgi:hypothetical protein